MMGIPAQPQPGMPQPGMPPMAPVPAAQVPVAASFQVDMTDPQQVALQQEYRMMLQQMTERNKYRVRFKFEPHLRRQYSYGLDPDRPICPYWNHYSGKKCPYLPDCPFKHPSKIFNNKIVCKYWLRGLCKMGDDCDFLHEYNLSKMPECAYYAANGVCQQAGECIYLHVDPQSKIPECWNYSNLGFCPDGPNCPKRHIRKVMCPRYLTGFCPDGPNCELAHPKWQIGITSGPKFKIVTDEEILEERKNKIKEEEEEEKREAAATSV